eukprot:7994203-Lingulodinium_polyedra.AAC.1
MLFCWPPAALPCRRVGASLVCAPARQRQSSRQYFRWAFNDACLSARRLLAQYQVNVRAIDYT